MRIPRLLTVLVALIAVGVVVAGGALLLRPPLPLIEEVRFDSEFITPDADGEDDIALFHYTLNRNATVSLTFADSDGNTFTFRDGEPRVPDEYSVPFSGIVHGYTLPDETVQGTVEARLLLDGTYTWTLAADAEDGEMAEATGTLEVRNGDNALPDVQGFSVSPDVFTPNQDGIADRMTANVYLTKDATLTLLLEGDNDVREFIAEIFQGVPEGEAGLHTFDYDGGIENGNEPPPDGTYRLTLTAEDVVGQRVSHTETIGIQNGGYPLAAIMPQQTGTTVFYDSLPYEERYYNDRDTAGDLIDVPEGVEPTISDTEFVQQGDLLVFRATVTNDGSVALRTTGPPPGTVYEQEQRPGSLGWFQESGAWRVGLECETAMTSYPWRWAIGADDVLEVVEDGLNTYYYLPPGEQAVVWGAVRLTEIEPRRNPQPCWLGLIHEDVAVEEADIDRRWVEIEPAPDVRAEDSTPDATPAS